METNPHDAPRADESTAFDFGANASESVQGSVKLKLTGLWVAEYERDGETIQYMKGRVGPGLELVIFPNTHRKSDRDPHFNAFFAKPRRRTEPKTQEEVKRYGLSRQTAGRVRRGLDAEFLSGPRLRGFVARVLWYLRSEGGKIPAGETWLGTSDVIESLFGKYKWLSEKAPYAEVGANVLALPVLTTELTAELLHEALTAVPVQDVREWVLAQVGRSTLSKVQAVRRAGENGEEQVEEDTKAA